MLPLRGFLVCPACGRMLTGSASKGRNQYYYYYHCNASCGTRFKAENANSLFIKELRKYVPNPGMNALYIKAVCEKYSERTLQEQGSRRQILL